MGFSTMDPKEWDNYRTTGASAASAAKMASNRGIKDAYDPRKFGIRESCDSAANPLSTPIAVIGDATGSLGPLAVSMVRDEMSRLAIEIMDKKPVSDPHLLFGILGDFPMMDPFPFQATQFEPDTKAADQAAELFVRGCAGGGNDSESYHAAWYFAARRTRIDSIKRGQKGLLVTYGDESVPPPLTPGDIKRVFGDVVAEDLSAQALLAEASRTYDVFHLIVADSDYLTRSGHLSRVEKAWRGLMGERVSTLTDHTKMPEVITSLARVVAGEKKADIVGSYSGSTQLVVSTALGAMVPKAPGSGLVRF